MTDFNLLEQAKEIIAEGCGCHRECEQLTRSEDWYCGCEKDAEKIIALVRAEYRKAESEAEQIGNTRKVEP